ncbi:MAG: BMP family ABC transporter substrate-binding protein [Bacteroidetes bacterium]|nr:BMP family ABC transporter substrate-binding protein [Bacteroidota bacterium]
MKAKPIVLFTLLFVLMQVLPSCTKEKDKAPKKIGLVAGPGGIQDKGFNQQAFESLVAASKVENIEYEVKESSSSSQIAGNIAYFTGKGVDMIIALGYDAADATKQAALANPGIKFLLIDYAMADLPSNMLAVSYQVDQASFPCGFLAAYWASVKDTIAPSVGYVAGPAIPAINQFTRSFEAGVQYYNTQHGKNVTVTGANAQVFNDTVIGAHLADSLLQLGVEVIFACAGKTGNGALYKVKESGKAAIGVDTDQYLTIPQVGNILLSSCLKKVDKAVYDELVSFNNNTFTGGQTIIYNLGNQGVDMAGYHDYESLVPDNIKNEIIDIKYKISQGTLNTGW